MMTVICYFTVSHRGSISASVPMRGSFSKRKPCGVVFKRSLEVLGLFVHHAVLRGVRIKRVLFQLQHRQRNVGTMVAHTLHAGKQVVEHEALVHFGKSLEEATMETITDGVVTGDLAALMDPKPVAVTSEDFIAAIRERLEKKL